jgi:4-amino-4-deoxy-L-arabinose transferase-like glycosyltransferase
MVIAKQLPLLLILLLAFSLRLLSARFLMGPIDSEGAEYARIAENLLSGNGYVGIAMPGKELMFPPLFPLLIAAVSLLTHEAEVAGRVISVTMGTMLVLPVYFIGLYLYNRRVASVAAMMTACHPLLVGFSATVFSETTYMVFVLSGAYWALRCLRLQTARALLLAGYFFGLAYLTRPEAALYPFLTIFMFGVGAAVIDRRQIRHVVLHSYPLLAAFLILASPYVAWLSAQSGQFRWEGKTPINLAIIGAQAAGKNIDEVMLGINPDLDDIGVWNMSNLSLIKLYPVTETNVISAICVKWPSNVFNAFTTIKRNSFGSIVLSSLIVLGMFSKSWNRELTISQSYLVFVVIGVPFVIMMGAYFMDTRYVIIVLPVMLIWAAIGLMQLFRWAGSTMRFAGSSASLSTKIGMVVALTAGAMLFLISLRGVGQVGNLTMFDYKNQPVKQAGKWLKTLVPGPKIVMDASTILAFEAGASYVPFPYAGSSLALKYIEKKKVDFIVFREAWLSTVPYIKDWLDNGIPDRRAQLIYSTDTQRGRILIYKWNPA